MASLGGIKVQDAPDKVPFVPLPAADYQCVIAESDWKDTSKGTGRFLKLVLEVLDEQYKGRKLFVNLNLENPSDKAVEIARSELKAISNAVGVKEPRDSAELHNLPFVARVGIEKNKETGELGNKVKDYFPRDGGKPGGEKPKAGGMPWKPGK